ncbi:hypothetical protein VMUT_2283 [Vulcanisaeta moutnovskia 768-28]|uniref:Uncharacterized protein n=1 Tax=Vulcanisaeta moutnovskia (strain 768-28) TaxID=985053 RepID=F0QXZ2_VULM7|nr:hypothetical protein [Vulcanisaeta moutnovskia]ADY02478.1 hypothetical protein VMUT_2283 [Vulcanisaeta moutnovskia 768-28]
MTDGRITAAKVRLCNPRDSGKCLELDLLVDMGSTYTWIKASRLRELEIEPMKRWRFRTVEDRIIERHRRSNNRAHGREDNSNRSLYPGIQAEALGMYPLEDPRLEVNPTTKQPKKTKALPAI